MKLYTFYSDTHTVLYEDYFLKSLKENGTEFELLTKKVDQKTLNGSFNDVGFNSTMKDKVSLLIDAINDNWGEWFLFSDCDIQFLKPFYDDIISYQKDGVDMVAQSDLGTLCAGFFMGYADDNLKKIMNKIYQNIENFHNDQLALNLYSNDINYELLDTNKYFTIANINGGNVWSGQTSYNVPKNILVHHSNFTIGVDDKIKLMKYIKENQ